MKAENLSYSHFFLTPKSAKDKCPIMPYTVPLLQRNYCSPAPRHPHEKTKEH